MPDESVSQLDPNTTPASTDLLHLIDDVAGTPTDQKIVLSDLLREISVTVAETSASVTPTDLRFEPGDVRRYGTNTVPDSTDMTVAIQNALDQAGQATGVPAYIVEKGIYSLTEQGAHPIRSGRRKVLFITLDDTELIIAPGVILKLADGQQTDANGGVEILSWSNARKNIRIHGGGRITGNTAGQTGWTSGYSQNLSGNIIVSYGAGPDGEKFEIEDLILDDHWSNSIALGLNLAGDRLSDCKFKKILSKNTGEGALMIGVDGIRIEDYKHFDDTGVTAGKGDALELSVCTDGLLTNIEIESPNLSGAGAAIDLFGSKNIVVNGFLIDGWNEAFSAATASAVTADEVIITNGVIQNCFGSNVLGFAEGKLVYENIRVYDCVGTLFQMNVDVDSLPPVELINVLGDSCAAAIIAGSREVQWHGGGNINSDAEGLNVNQNSSGETRNLDLLDLDFRGATGSEILYNAAGQGPQLMVGRMVNIKMTAVNDFVSTDDDDFTSMIFENVTPNVLASNVGTITDSPHIKTLTRTANNFLTMTQPSQDQIVYVEAGGTFTVVDKSGGGGVDFNLAGSGPYAMTVDDRLILKWNGTAWFEFGRSVN